MGCSFQFLLNRYIKLEKLTWFVGTCQPGFSLRVQFFHCGASESG